MRSPMLQASNLPNKSNYSDLQVLKSNAGWYIGTVYIDRDTGMREPGSRDSGYYPSEEAAQADLDKLIVDPNSVRLRTHP